MREEPTLTKSEGKHLVYALELVEKLIEEYKIIIEAGDIVFHENALTVMNKLFEAILYLECDHDYSCDCGHILVMVKDAKDILSKIIKK
ncbi:MAG: hypothetical protein GYA51_10430 [Candidatus Methanofastidiosa archaeon]|nr:hypothetical protein [Candidatus Methanofastidiosa archaeon]